MNQLRAFQLKTPSVYPATISFSFMPADYAKKNSVITVTNAHTFNETGRPTEGGLYDLKMGPVDAKSGKCSTCTLNYNQCPGHFGLIQLPLPVFNPLYKRELVSLLKMTCLTCKRLCTSGIIVLKTCLFSSLKLITFSIP